VDQVRNEPGESRLSSVLCAAVGGPAAALLFERLPDRLFKPLAAVNRHRYWTLLCYLHRQRFGPDAPLPPSNGFSSREIVQDIERALAEMDDWDVEDVAGTEVEPQATPIGIRAATIVHFFVEAGWLKYERHGIERRLMMAPTVNHFLSQLVAFAETGPVFVGGKIRSIEANIQMVLDGGDGASLMEAADQTRSLLEHVRNTGTSVRDLMEAMGADIPTAQYVRRFFDDYVEQVFVGDYHQLRTRDHPLARRAMILGMIEQIYSSQAHRQRLLAWYQAQRCNGDSERALWMFERDVSRLRELVRIDEYLSRLDDEIRRANRRALAFLGYRLRSSQPVDMAIDAAIRRVMASGEEIEEASLAAGPLVAPDLLASPRLSNQRPKADGLRSSIPRPEEMARSRLRERYREARSMTAPKLVDFFARHLDRNTGELRSEDIDVQTIEDLRALQTLGSLALAMSTRSRQLRQNALATAGGLTATITRHEEEDGPYLSGTPFSVSAKSRNKAKEREGS
jgi:Wadjet anti plasmid transformation system JetA-like protein